MTEPEREYDTVTAADRLDVLRYIEDSDPQPVATDTALMALAGLRLTYAIYHSGKDFILSMPNPLLRAYANACTVFDPSGYRASRAELQTSTAPTSTCSDRTASGPSGELA